MSSPGWERELQVLDEAIRRLKAEYDAFLYGTAGKPPEQLRRDIEQMMRKLNASEKMSAADRYRFLTLQGRYTSLQERSERLVGEKEAGRRPGLYGHFGPVEPPRPGREVASGARSEGGANVRAPGSVIRERPASREEADRDLFDRYVAAKKAAGEDVSGYRLEGFLEGLERERRKVKERMGTDEVLFDIAERDGRVRLIAKKKRSSR